MVGSIFDKQYSIVEVKGEQTTRAHNEHNDMSERKGATAPAPPTAAAPKTKTITLFIFYVWTFFNQPAF